MGFNNPYALLMRRQQARQLGIASIYDLAATCADLPTLR
ncbi:hypothetical protein ACFPAF_07625 [Hymenobacter endophyticus]|uniref:Uncharacterized protein n=1 Tax=Hymenobacter endophyticus TaxID=3076335 RepID=A0ABU3TFW1_9BACT|nr:hypothetical protein [Hymenobacter endophyticus]MDU0370254.1 hypothetical protein [Hymenobacter endophyticus]